MKLEDYKIVDFFVYLEHKIQHLPPRVSELPEIA